MNTKRITIIWFIFTLMGIIMMFAPFFKLYCLKESIYLELYFIFSVIYLAITTIFVSNITKIK